jgi:hypothetical protein
MFASFWYALPLWRRATLEDDDQRFRLSDEDS